MPVFCSRVTVLKINTRVSGISMICQSCPRISQKILFHQRVCGFQHSSTYLNPELPTAQGVRNDFVSANLFKAAAARMTEVILYAENICSNSSRSFPELSGIRKNQVCNSKTTWKQIVDIIITLIAISNWTSRPPVAIQPSNHRIWGLFSFAQRWVHRIWGRKANPNIFSNKIQDFIQDILMHTRSELCGCTRELP